MQIIDELASHYRHLEFVGKVVVINSGYCRVLLDKVTFDCHWLEIKQVQKEEDTLKVVTC